MSALAAQLDAIGERARAAYRTLAATDAASKDRALGMASQALRDARPTILAANARDMEAAQALSDAMRDRLRLDESRIEAMADAVATVAALPDPVGQVLASWEVARNGLRIE